MQCGVPCDCSGPHGGTPFSNLTVEAISVGPHVSQLTVALLCFTVVPPSSPWKAFIQKFKANLSHDDKMQVVRGNASISDGRQHHASRHRQCKSLCNETRDQQRKSKVWDEGRFLRGRQKPKVWHRYPKLLETKAAVNLLDISGDGASTGCSESRRQT